MLCVGCMVAIRPCRRRSVYISVSGCTGCGVALSSIKHGNWATYCHADMKMELSENRQINYDYKLSWIGSRIHKRAITYKKKEALAERVTDVNLHYIFCTFDASFN